MGLTSPLPLAWHIPQGHSRTGASACFVSTSSAAAAARLVMVGRVQILEMATPAATELPKHAPVPLKTNDGTDLFYGQFAVADWIVDECGPREVWDLWKRQRLETIQRVYQIRCYTPSMGPLVRQYGNYVSAVTSSEDDVPMMAIGHAADDMDTIMTCVGAENFFVQHSPSQAMRFKDVPEDERPLVTHLVVTINGARWELAELISPDDVRQVITQATVDADGNAIETTSRQQRRKIERQALKAAKEALKEAGTNRCRASRIKRAVEEEASKSMNK